MASNSKRTLTTAVEVDTEKAQKNLRKLGEQAEDTARDAQRLGEDLKDAGQDAGHLEDASKDAAVDVERLADELRDTGKKAKDTGRDVERLGKDIDEAGDYADEFRGEMKEGFEGAENAGVGAASALGEAWGEGGTVQDAASSFTEVLESVAEGFGPLAPAVALAGGAIIGWFARSSESAEELADKTADFFDALVEGAGQVEEAQKDLNYREWVKDNNDLAESVRAVAGQRGLQLLRESVNGTAGSYDELRETIQKQQAVNADELEDLYALSRTTDGLTEAQKKRQKELLEANRKSRQTLEQLDSEEAALNDARRAWENYALGIGKATTQIVNNLRASKGQTPLRPDTIARNIAKNSASGGPVTAGQPYIVGEYGKELFVPDTDGTIVSAPDLRRAGGGVTVVMNVTSNDPTRIASQTAAALRRHGFRNGT